MAALIPAAKAQTVLQQLVSPGALTAKHAEFESKCESCHASFDKQAQSRLCLDCHKETAADYAAKRGFHGRLQPADRPCSSCHTDHEGRGKNIVVFEPRTFDHRLTDYPLRDAHAKVECASCHAPGRVYREAASDCATCHRDDEPHRRQLGNECQSCHNQLDWDEIRFDHGKTDFALTGGHMGAECTACHAEQHYTNVSTTCISCHRTDEPHKGQLGVQCEACHNDTDWDRIRFDHAKTKFALTGAHVRSECTDCHADQHYRNVATACVSCHRKEDVHEARLGENCASCHTAADWTVKKFDHGTTKFALNGKHAEARCETCHVQSATKVSLPLDCVSCHDKDDEHRGVFGAACEQCHGATDWKTAPFDHTARTDFILLGKHTDTKCADCHAPGARSANIETTCISCHERDDEHAKQLGVACDQCHSAKAWDVEVVFDHDLSRFPLIGQHGESTCDECHTSKRYKEAPLPCLDCHRDDDVHKTALGVKCGDCHNPVTWASSSFSHDTQTKWPLNGAHAQATCADCHLPDQQRVKTTCVDCHRTEDVHSGRFGTDCGRCHTAVSFKALRRTF